MGGTCWQPFLLGQRVPRMYSPFLRILANSLGREAFSKSIFFPSARVKGISEAVHSLRFLVEAIRVSTWYEISKLVRRLFFLYLHVIW
jgi:hypothetical protein